MRLMYELTPSVKSIILGDFMNTTLRGKEQSGHFFINFEMRQHLLDP